jgi:long-chain acyl-CoA synthetase
MERDFGAIADLVRLHAQHTPDHAALADAPHSQYALNYGALDALMDRIAASLQRDGLKAGDAIAVCATSSVNYAAVFLGALRAGVAVAPLAPGSTPASLARMIQDADAHILFTDASAAEVVGPAKEGGIARIALDGSSAGRDFAAFQHHLFLGTTGTPKGIVQPHGDALVAYQPRPAVGFRRRGDDGRRPRSIRTPPWSASSRPSPGAAPWC